MRDLSDLFAERQTNVLEWDGGLVYGLYEFPRIPRRFTVDFISSKDDPVQGLNFKMRGGVMSVDGVETDDLLLWRDTAPDQVDVVVHTRSKAKASLKVWNVWRGGSDVTQAWLGNAAIRVDEKGDRVDLHCSDGDGPPTFDDLIAFLRLE